jgi:bacillithiol synthase
LSVEIRAGPIGGSRLVDDYIRDEATLRPFFPAAPFDPASYRAKAAELRARFPADALSAMADAVRPLSDEARDRLAEIAGGRGYFVTTGQQPGFLGGPLYTVSKALTAIALARRLEGILEAPVLALFWIASDDHDWEEANHVHMLDTGNALRRLVLVGRDRPPRSMGRRVLGEGAEIALGELAQILPPSEFAPDLLSLLRGAYRPDGSVASAFADTLAGLFAGYPLGLVDAQDSAVRRLGEPVIRRALTESSAHEEALVEQTGRLEEAGYDAQVSILPGASNVFHEDDLHGRERLLREDGAWSLKSSGRALSDVEVRALLERDPGRFSPNVVLRPVVESAIFPTLAYVAGPGEVRYLAQTRLLFDAHGVGMPLVFPRQSLLLIEAKVKKVLEKFGLEPSALLRPMQDLIAAVVRDDVPAEVQASLGRLRSALASGYADLSEQAKIVDPTLNSPIMGARSDALRSLGEVEKKIRQHVKLNRQTDLEQMEKAAMNLAPLGKPQERVLGVFQFLARYGSALMASMLGEIDASLDARLGMSAVAGREPRGL